MSTASSAAAPASAHDTAVFEERMIGALNSAGLMLMISIGHRTGLLEIMAKAPPLTSAALATRAGLQERYVREWLGAMVTGGVVEMDPAAGTYRLPARHAALLTDTEGTNLAVYAQFMGLLGSVEDDVVRCFHEGGGVPYERYPRFHEVMASDSAQTVLPALFDHILPLAPGLMGRLQAGIRVLDVACGRGRALVNMAERFPASRFSGYDLSADAVEWARDNAARAGVENVHFEVRDLTDFDVTAQPAAFDLITVFDGIHDQARPRRVLAGIRRSLADDGVLLVQDIHGSSHHHSDIDHPLGTMLYTVSCMHCMTVSLAQGGDGLGTMWGRERALEHLRDAGFADVTVHQLEHDVQNDYFVCRIGA